MACDVGQEFARHIDDFPGVLGDLHVDLGYFLLAIDICLVRSKRIAGAQAAAATVHAAAVVAPREGAVDDDLALVRVVSSIRSLLAMRCSLRLIPTGIDQPTVIIGFWERGCPKRNKKAPPPQGDGAVLLIASRRFWKRLPQRSSLRATGPMKRT